MVKTANTKRKNAPPPIRIHSQTRERPFSAINLSSLTPGDASGLCRGNHLQRPRYYTQHDRSPASVFAIGVHIDGVFGFDPHPLGPGILDFAEPQMTPEVNRGK